MILNAQERRYIYNQLWAWTELERHVIKKVVYECTDVETLLVVLRREIESLKRFRNGQYDFEPAGTNVRL